MGCAGTILIADAIPESAAYTAVLLEKAGYETVVCTDGRQALDACTSTPVHTVIADAVLPYADGCSLAKLIRRTDTYVIPGIVVTHPKGMRRKADAPGICLLERPFSADGLISAIKSVEPLRREPTEEMRACVCGYLDSICMPAHPGRDYIMQAVFMACEDMSVVGSLSSKLYPHISERYGVSPKAVERAMRHAIEKTWMSGSIDSLYSIFGNTIDAGRGKPTCGGMIAQLAQMLRREVF